MINAHSFAIFKKIKIHCVRHFSDKLVILIILGCEAEMNLTVALLENVHRECILILCNSKHFYVFCVA